MRASSETPPLNTSGLTDYSFLYNQTLENAAQDYANTCPKGLSPVSSREGTGEIYQSLPSNTLALMDVIEAALKASWHPIMVHGFDPSLEFTDLTPHLANAPLMFTQMAWGSTYSVGCAATRCSDNTTVICRYNPRLSSFTDATDKIALIESNFQKPSTVLNATARLYISSCNARRANLPDGHSISIYAFTSQLVSSMGLDFILGYVLSEWRDEPVLLGIDDNMMYTNTELRAFANMFYYKSTEVGCYYNLCNTTGQATHAVACVFNMTSRLAQGLVPNGNTGKKLPAGTDIAQLSYNRWLESEAQVYANNCPTGLSSEVSHEGIMGEIYQSLPSETLTDMDVISTALKASWHQIYTAGFNDQLEFKKSLETIPNAPVMFTQMAWANTREVGCAAARCSSNTTVICRYYPR
ncbi:unnamed protein product [Haemonchus placei]|uniref:SCP domain-containing protein n=1 Tax=Haemonchus placei TaxID=6290 RepID=A0A158QRW3_HAEPC|nr:unnamed protein product [Haemonchus placei]